MSPLQPPTTHPTAATRRTRLWRLALWETFWTVLGLLVLLWVIRDGLGFVAVLLIGGIAIAMGVVWLRLGQALFEASENEQPTDQNG